MYLAHESPAMPGHRRASAQTRLFSSSSVVALTEPGEGVQGDVFAIQMGRSWDVIYSLFASQDDTKECRVWWKNFPRRRGLSGLLRLVSSMRDFGPTRRDELCLTVPNSVVIQWPAAVFFIDKPTTRARFPPMPLDLLGHPAAYVTRNFWILPGLSVRSKIILSP
jgi:hypothetical protein